MAVGGSLTCGRSIYRASPTWSYLPHGMTWVSTTASCVLSLCLSASLPLFLTLCVPGEHHYVGPYNLQHYGYQRYNAFPHLAYLELSSYFIQWYKLPAGSPAPPITTEQLFYFYNLQPANNSCPGDPVGPGRFVLDDPEFPLEDRL